jgi:MarR family transcriptional regulator, organic hydroperoxide resistance regulator
MTRNLFTVSPNVAAEIKQTRPFGSRAEEAAVALMRTADLVRRNLAAVLGPHDLTGQQYNVLRILRGAGEKGLPTLEIAERMIEETPGITRLIDRLEAKGLVARERCATDRRQVFCRITRAGAELLASLDRPLGEAIDAAMSGLKKRELTELVALLDRTRDSLHDQLQIQRSQE